MSIRITGGEFRGIKLAIPKELNAVVRPTQDKVRQAIFSSLASRIDISELSVLDLFSGTGIMSFEAISRGATSATMVDSNGLALMSCLENAKKIKIEEKISQVKADCLSYLSKQEQKFDLVFIDPPYRKYNFEIIILELIKKSALSSSGTVVYEEDTKFFNSQYALSRDIIASYFSSINLKTYGSTSVAFFQF